MSITRINSFQAKDDTVNNLREFLLSIIPLVNAAQGCKSCRLLQKQDTHEFLIIEEWDSVASHQASVNSIPQEKLTAIMPMLASPPSGSYYTS